MSSVFAVSVIYELEDALVQLKSFRARYPFEDDDSSWAIQGMMMELNGFSKKVAEAAQFINLDPLLPTLAAWQQARPQLLAIVARAITSVKNFRKVAEAGSSQDIDTWDEYFKVINNQVRESLQDLQRAQTACLNAMNRPFQKVEWRE